MSDQANRGGLTRRQLLQGAGGAAALALAGGGAWLSGAGGSSSGGAVSPAQRAAKHLPEISSRGVKPAGRIRDFDSQPHLRPPTVAISEGGASQSADPGFLFLGPGPVSLKGSQQYGPMIVDRVGAPVWFRPLQPGMLATNFARWSYRGQPVLAWWEGTIEPKGYGHGEAVLVDGAYREIARVRAAGGRSMDLHGLTVTPEGTALFTCYPETVQMDLSSIGAPSDSRVLGSIIQEVDIATGRLLFEWRSLQHIPVSASREPHSEPYDYLHVNSIDPLPDGNLLISARHTWALYKLDRRSGNVIWTLGGNQSQFHMGPGTEFSWQHDAHHFSDRMLTLFDNGSSGPIHSEHQSRGLLLDVDEPHRKVTLRNAYVSRRPQLAGAMGSVQILSSGHVVVGWGTDAVTSRFDASGTLLSEFALPGGMFSYRGLWFPWKAMPRHRPTVAARRVQRDATNLYASWNGATEVTGWEVEAGTRPDRLRALGVARRHGFETVIPVPHGHRYASVTALDRVGTRLKRSPVVKL